MNRNTGEYNLMELQVLVPLTANQHHNEFVFRLISSNCKNILQPQSPKISIGDLQYFLIILMKRVLFSFFINQYLN